MGILAQEQVMLLSDYDANSAYNIAYQTVYTNIRFDWNSQQAQQYAILFTTPAYYPGQASTPANIAIAAAQSGTPAILVDADLRRSCLHQRFGGSITPGLSDWLAGQAPKEATAARFLNETFIPGLYFLSAGTISFQPQEINRLFTANLSDIVASMRLHLAETESKPGMIVFHSPPVLTGIEASLIGALVERTFLVIAAGYTTRTQAKLAQEQLRRAHATLAGSILLDV